MGGRETLTTSPLTGLSQALVMMGPEEVLIQGGNVSVNGQLVPDGESQLLPSKGQSACGTQKGSKRGNRGLSWLLPPHPHCCWEAFGNEGAS